VTLTFDLSTPKTMSLLGYSKIMHYTKFEHFGIIRFWGMLRTNKQTGRQTAGQTDTILRTPTDTVGVDIYLPFVKWWKLNVIALNRVNVVLRRTQPWTVETAVSVTRRSHCYHLGRHDALPSSDLRTTQSDQRLLHTVQELNTGATITTSVVSEF